MKSCDLPANRKYVFGYHPHGIIGMGAIANFGTEGEHLRKLCPYFHSQCSRCTSATGFSDLFPGLKPHLLTVSASRSPAQLCQALTFRGSSQRISTFRSIEIYCKSQQEYSSLSRLTPPCIVWYTAWHSESAAFRIALVKIYCGGVRQLDTVQPASSRTAF